MLVTVVLCCPGFTNEALHYDWGSGVIVLQGDCHVRQLSSVVYSIPFPRLYMRRPSLHRGGRIRHKKQHRCGTLRKWRLLRVEGLGDRGTGV
jgi:hypothetical protein